MARKKKTEETVTTVTEIIEEPVELDESFMNTPEEEIIPVVETVEEIKEEKKVRKVLQFTPVGPKITYI